MSLYHLENLKILIQKTIIPTVYYTQYINVFSIVCTTSVFDTHAEKRRGEGRLQGHFFGGGETERWRGSKALRERALKAAVATTKAAA